MGYPMKCHYKQEYSLKAIHKINPSGLFIAYTSTFDCSEVPAKPVKSTFSGTLMKNYDSMN
jgi:hypothetical protein